jgi:hypothetical protein
MVYLWCLCGVKRFLPFFTSFYKFLLAGGIFLFIGLVLNLAFGLVLRTSAPFGIYSNEDFGNRSFVGLSHYFQITQFSEILFPEASSKLEQANT